MKKKDREHKLARAKYEAMGRYKYQASKYIEEARQQGVVFKVEEYAPHVYEIRVEGEQGVVLGVPLEKLPVMLHGLFLMGEKLRAKRMSVWWNAKMKNL